MAIYNVTLNQTWQAQQVRNVWHYETTPDDVPVAEFQGAADAIRSAFATQAVQFATTWSLDNVTFRRVDLANFPGFTVEFTAGPLVGTNGNQSVATQVALLISGVVFGTPPPNRTRTYHAGLAEPSTGANGLWVGAAQTAMGQINIDADDFLTATVSWDRVAVRYDPITDTVVESNDDLEYGASPVPATQRRRRIGVGI